MAALPPCLVIGTPRSRTAWLAKFLSTPERPFVHEPSVHWKGLDDLYRFLDGAGCASDSGLTLFWREAVRHRPDTRLIVVRRTVGEIVNSFQRAGAPITDAATRVFYRVWREAVVASAHHYAMPVPFWTMTHAPVCSAIFRQAHWHKPPRGYVTPWLAQNIQRDWREQFAAVAANRDGFPALFAERARDLPEAA
jgi:hypothetical protein